MVAPLLKFIVSAMSAFPGHPVHQWLNYDQIIKQSVTFKVRAKAPSKLGPSKQRGSLDELGQTDRAKRKAAILVDSKQQRADSLFNLALCIKLH